MSEDWYVIKPQPTMLNGLETEEWDNWVIDGFDELLTETPLGKEIYLCKGEYDGVLEVFETELKTEGIIQNVTPDAYTQGWKRQVLTRISDNLADYKYIKVKDTENNWQIYLIMTMPDTNGMYTKAAIHECNYILKWQDKETFQIRYCPCSIENASQYNTGENSVNSVIRTGFSQLMAWMPFEDYTLDIDRSYRFFIDYSPKTHLVYRTTSMNHVDYSYREQRIIRLIFTEDAYNPDIDNLDLWICGYANPDDIPQPTTPIEILYSGNPEIRIGGRKTLRVESENSVVFSLLADSSLSDKVSFEQSENQCVVRVVNDINIVGCHFKVVATCGAEYSELLMTIKGVM